MTEPNETAQGGRDARAIAKKLARELQAGCGDHSCRFNKPQGAGTNGGCRCADRIQDALELFARPEEQGAQTFGGPCTVVPTATGEQAALWLFGAILLECFAEVDEAFRRRDAINREASAWLGAQAASAKPIDAALLHANRHKLIGETEHSERPARIREGWLWCVDPDCTHTEPDANWCKWHGTYDKCWVTKADQDAVERGHSYEDQT